MMNKQLTLIKSSADAHGNFWILWSHGNYGYSIDIYRDDKFILEMKMDADFEEAVEKFNILVGEFAQPSAIDRALSGMTYNTTH
jgi:hypothetical protein